MQRLKRFQFSPDTIDEMDVDIRVTAVHMEQKQMVTSIVVVEDDQDELTFNNAARIQRPIVGSASVFDVDQPLGKASGLVLEFEEEKASSLSPGDVEKLDKLHRDFLMHLSRKERISFFAEKGSEKTSKLAGIPYRWGIIRMGRRQH